MRPIGYTSRTRNDAEKIYSVTHQEALAIVWALRHFRTVIFEYPITVSTDHCPCLELFKDHNLTGRLARCYLTILEFNPTFHYVPRTQNVAADALSHHTPSAVSSVVLVDPISPDLVMTEQRIDPIFII